MEATSLADLWDPRDPDLYVTLEGAAVASMTIGGMIERMTGAVALAALAYLVSLDGLMTMTGESDLSSATGACLDDSPTLDFLPFLF